MKTQFASLFKVWAACAFLASFSVAAQQTTSMPPPPPADPQPPAIVDDKTAAKANPQPAQTNITTGHGQVNLGDPELEPQVTIIQRENERHEEVRVNGQLRYVRVVPVFGPVYYLIPMPNGQMMRQNDLDPSMRPPMWGVFSW